jgi:hypothetical protein
MNTRELSIEKKILITTVYRGTVCGAVRPDIRVLNETDDAIDSGE